MLLFVLFLFLIFSVKEIVLCLLSGCFFIVVIFIIISVLFRFCLICLFLFVCVLVLYLCVVSLI